MSFEKNSEDEDQQTSSKSSVISSSNHGMFLRSSCGSSACTAGIYCAARKRNKTACHSNHSCNSVVTEHQDFAHSNHSKQEFVSQLHHSEWTKRTTTATYRTEVHVRNKNGISSEKVDGSSLTKTLQGHALEKGCLQSLSLNISTASKDMARTLYKRNALARALGNSDVAENELSLHLETNVSQRNGSKLNQSISESKQMSVGRRLNESKTTSNAARYEEVDEHDKYLNSRWNESLPRKSFEDYNLHCTNSFLTEKESSSLQEQTSVFWSFFSWRKYLYLALSKPTHYDVELLERIGMFGKYKTTFLLLLPLLLLLLSGMLGRNGTSFQQVHKLMEETNKYNFMLGWWSKTVVQPVEDYKVVQPIEDHKVVDKLIEDHKVVDKLIEDHKVVDKLKQPIISQPVVRDHQENNSTKSEFQQISRNEVKILIKEILREELLPRILEEKTKGEKIEETKREIQDIWKELNSFSAKIDSVYESLTSMQQHSEAATHVLSGQEKLHEERDSHFHQVNEKVKVLQKQFVVLDQMLTFAKNCCRNETEIEGHMAAALMSLLHRNSSNSEFQSFMDWMSSEYINSGQLHQELDNLKASFTSQESDLKAQMQTLLKDRLESVHKEFSAYAAHATGSNSTFSVDVIQKIVKEAIMLYDADKLGKTDYALESGGGAVINTRCSESYNQGQPTLNIFGIPLWNLGSSPRNAIQPDMHPGQCWAFKGSQGYLVIELSSTVRPTSFVMEHIPMSLSPTGNIDSAPKDFTVLGLTSEKDENGKVLGEYTYEKDGPPLQQFPVENGDDNSYYPFMELQIRSNHGHLKYTCLYRFRVHGVRK